MQPPSIDADRLRQLLPITDAIDALDRAFRAPLADAPLRTRVEAPAGELLLMPAVGASYAGVKLVGVAPENPARGRPVVQAAYVLFDGPTLSPVAVIDGTALTTLRTGAVSALATRSLARSESRILTIVGAGVQGTVHLEAMAAVRPIDRVRVVSRTREPAEGLARLARNRGFHAEVGGPDLVGGADIVCTCTTSPTPVFDGAALTPGAHVNAVGAYRPEDRELDDETIRRARIVVETRDAALAEAGDVIIPLERGVISPGDVVAELADVVRGAPVRGSPEDITVFKSVGLAVEDLTVASAVYERWRST